MVKYTVTDPTQLGTFEPVGDLINLEGVLGTYKTVQEAAVAVGRGDHHDGRLTPRPHSTTSRGHGAPHTVPDPPTKRRHACGDHDGRAVALPSASRRSGAGGVRQRRRLVEHDHGRRGRPPPRRRDGRRPRRPPPASSDHRRPSGDDHRGVGRRARRRATASSA